MNAESSSIIIINHPKDGGAAMSIAQQIAEVTAQAQTTLAQSFAQATHDHKLNAAQDARSLRATIIGKLNAGARLSQIQATIGNGRIGLPSVSMLRLCAQAQAWCDSLVSQDAAPAPAPAAPAPAPAAIVAVRLPLSADNLLQDENCSVGALQAVQACCDEFGRQIGMIYAERRNAEAPAGAFLLPAPILGSHQDLGLCWYDESAQALVFTTWKTPAVATWQAQA